MSQLSCTSPGYSGGLFLVCRGGPSRTAAGTGALAQAQSGPCRGAWVGSGPWRVDHGTTLEKEAPPEADTGAPRSPSHYQLAGRCLTPPSPAQPCHNLLLHDLSWQGTSLEINSDDIPANSQAWPQTGLFVWAGEGSSAHFSPASDPSSGLTFLRSETGPLCSPPRSSREGQSPFVKEQEQKQRQGNLPPWAPSQLMHLVLERQLGSTQHPKSCREQ